MMRGPTDKDVALSNALKKFQNFTGLEMTGILDKATQELMNTPRCGLDDRVAEFVARDRKWRKRELTYRIVSYPTNGLRRKSVDRETARAFSMWQEVSNLKFKKKIFWPCGYRDKFCKRRPRRSEPF